MQPVAISAKSRGRTNRRNKPKPLPWFATGCRQKYMVRRGSTVRVRKGLCSRSELAVQGDRHSGSEQLRSPDRLPVVKNYGQYPAAIAVDSDALQAWRWECLGGYGSLVAESSKKEESPSQPQSSEPATSAERWRGIWSAAASPSSSRRRTKRMQQRSRKSWVTSRAPPRSKRRSRRPTPSSSPSGSTRSRSWPRRTRTSCRARWSSIPRIRSGSTRTAR